MRLANYLPHAEKENSVKTLHCLAVNLSLEKRLQELTSRKNLELESHRQFVVLINLVLVTPATSMAPDRTGPAVPSRSVLCARAGPPYPPALACALERTLQLHLSVEPTRKAAVTGYKPQCLTGVERGARGRFLRWEGSSDLTGQLSPAQAGRPPVNNRVLPGALLIGFMGIRYGNNRKADRNIQH